MLALISFLAWSLAGFAMTAPAQATAPAASSGTAASARFSITLDKLEPKVVQQGDTLQLAGTLKNTSGITLTNVSIALRVSSQRIATRYDLARDADPATQIGFVVSSTRQRFGTVQPNDTLYWTVSVPVKNLGLPTSVSQFGAYPLAIEATSTADSRTGHDRLPTTLMWVPKGAQFAPTKVGWLWPLIDGVHRGMGDTFLNDDLAKDLAPGGRIGRLTKIAADSKLPLTYVVDPALVDDATAMAARAAGPQAPASGAPSTTSASPTPAKPTSTTPAATKPAATKSADAKATLARPGATATKSGGKASPSSSGAPYLVASGGGTEPGSGAAVAANWLTELRSLIKTPGSELMGVPYGDPDVVALDRAGLHKEIAIARSAGQATLLTELAPPTLPNVVWPVDSALNESTLDDLSSDLVTTVVLSDQTLQPRDADELTGPRTDLQTASGTVRVVLTDSTIDTLIADPSSVLGGPRAAEQRLLAETMLITEQRPGQGSSLMLAPPRYADPSNPYLQAMLRDTGDVPWLKMVNLGAIINQPSDTVARQPLNYPRSARQAELPQNLLTRIGALRDGLSRFNAVLDVGTTEPFLTAANLAIVRAESSWWRSNPANSSQITSAVQASLAAHTGKVVISNPELITLTSRRQKIPITVVNNLPEPVTVQLQLAAANPARLNVMPIAPFTIDGKGGRHEVLIEVEAPTNGRFDVRAQLMTPETTPRPFGAAVSFEVNSTAYGAVALAIAGTAAGLIVLLSGVRLFRRFRRARRGSRADTGAGPQIPESAHPDADPDLEAARDSTDLPTIP